MKGSSEGLLEKSLLWAKPGNLSPLSDPGVTRRPTPAVSTSQAPHPAPAGPCLQPHSLDGWPPSLCLRPSQPPCLRHRDLSESQPWPHSEGEVGCAQCTERQCGRVTGSVTRWDSEDRRRSPPKARGAICQAKGSPSTGRGPSARCLRPRASCRVVGMGTEASGVTGGVDGVEVRDQAGSRDFS